MVADHSNAGVGVVVIEGPDASLYDQATREDVERWLQEIEEALEEDRFEPTEQEARRIEAVMDHLRVTTSQKPLTPKAVAVVRKIRDRAVSGSNT